MQKRLSTILLSLIAIAVSAVAQESRGLKDAYAPYFKIGVAVNQRNVTDSAQMALIRREFNSMTAENDMKPASIQPREGEFRWERADRIANFCRANGIKLRGHCLAWHNQFCDWMFYDAEGKLVQKEVLYDRMRKHIHAVVSRYKDVVYAWDVVNEAISDGGGDNPLRKSKFYEVCGSDEFIRKAFIFAREADPKALLFYNDYNECEPGKRDRIYNMVKEMKAAGVPIDGIGMQGHYNIYGPSEEEIEAAVAKYAEIVDYIHLTELDIRVNREMGGQLKFNRNEGVQITDEQKQKQQERYEAVFRVMRKHADKVDCVTFWNLGDRDSWLGANNYPLLFDRDYQPKQVYFKVRDFSN